MAHEEAIMLQELLAEEENYVADLLAPRGGLIERAREPTLVDQYVTPTHYRFGVSIRKTLVSDYTQGCAACGGRC
jgi:hypothetical protein